MANNEVRKKTLILNSTNIDVIETSIRILVSYVYQANGNKTPEKFVLSLLPPEEMGRAILQIEF